MVQQITIPQEQMRLAADHGASIQMFGTSNPKVAEFLKATFALEAMGMNLQHATEAASPSGTGQQRGGPVVSV